MRILGIERDTKACNYYRILEPLAHIQEQGLADCTLIETGTPLDSDEALDKVFTTDIVLLPRPSSEEWFGFIKACRKAGKTVVSDYDDNPFECSPFNPYYRWIGVEEWVHPDFGWVWKHGMKEKDGTEWFNVEKNINRRDMVRASFKYSDLVTCTTPELREVFLKINPNTSMLPNYIDFNWYPKAELKKDKIRIGWQGGVSHYEELHFVRPILEEISKLDDVEVVYFGDQRFVKLFKDVKNLIAENWVHHMTYPYKMKLLNVDIGLCPLIDNVFNRCKSAIKYYEYTAVGAATIASNIPPYSYPITNEKDGVLVENDVKKWVEAIKRLVKDKKKILEISRNAHDNVSENYTIQKNVHKWVDEYEKIIKHKMETVEV